MTEATADKQSADAHGEWIAIGAGMGMVVGPAAGSTGAGLVLGAAAGVAYEGMKSRTD